MLCYVMVWHDMIRHDIRFSKLGVKLNDIKEREAPHGVRGGGVDKERERERDADRDRASAMQLIRRKKDEKEEVQD